MMRWIYDFGFFLFSIFMLPHFLGKLRQADDRARLVRERFGRFSEEKRARLEGPSPVWIHTVSVGEAMAVERFLHQLLERRPKLRVVLTTVTPTGQAIARQWEDERVTVLYFPFDFRFAVRRFFEAVRPELLLLTETEIWPNVIEEAAGRSVPIGVINGRLSERSFKAFRRFSLIFTPLLSRIDSFLVQSQKDRERLLALGVHPDLVSVTGNMKLDQVDFGKAGEEERRLLREKWGLLDSDQVLLGGSTHPGEEEILLRAFRSLREDGCPLKLILAPRHIERSRKILEAVKEQGFRGILMSSASEVGSAVTGGEIPPLLPYDVLILDRLGELRKLYLAADVVVMGGSFIPHGGQNPVEPARVCRPVVHGPCVFNFEELYQNLDEGGGSLRVNGEPELLFVLKRLFANPPERKALGRRAYEVIEGLRGATERNLAWFDRFTKTSKGVYAHAI